MLTIARGISTRKRRVLGADGTPGRFPGGRGYDEREFGYAHRMADRTSREENGNTIKDPDDWKTGDEPMTGAQRSYLETLAEESGEEVPDGLTKAEASEKIDELQEESPRLR